MRGARIIAQIALLTSCALPLVAQQQREIMSWVPPYGLAQSRQALQHTAGTITADQWLSRVGLQFWLVNADGTVEYASRGDTLNDAAVAWFRDWAHQRGVKALLTIYNHDGKKWDWDRARSAFITHQDAFVANLVAETEKHHLDGIDLDLEGNGSLDQDRPAFAAFVHKLSAALKAKGKLLTVDSFHSPCFNAPHMGWWEDWKGEVDAIHSMGYGDLYEGSTERFVPEGSSGGCMNGDAIFKLSWQVKWGTTHGYKAGQLLLGFPGGSYEWGEGGMGKTLPDHLREAAAVGAGISIWDIPGTIGGRRDARWGSEESWAALKRFRSGK